MWGRRIQGERRKDEEGGMGERGGRMYHLKVRVVSERGVGLGLRFGWWLRLLLLGVLILVVLLPRRV